MKNDFFFFQGLDPNQPGELDYTKKGDSYRELVTLLKSTSPKFAEMIDKQSFALKVKEKDDLLIQPKREKTRDDGDDDYQQRQDNRMREQTQDMDNKQKSKAQKKKKLEPSLKWRALGMEEYHER